MNKILRYLKYYVIGVAEFCVLLLIIKFCFVFGEEAVLFLGSVPILCLFGWSTLETINTFKEK